MAKRKKSNTANIVSGIISFLLVAALVIACGIGSAIDGVWFKNPDISKWFNNWGKTEQTDYSGLVVSLSGKNNGLLTLAMGESGIKRDSFTLTAEVATEVEEVKKVTWSSSNTTCVTVTPTTADGLTAEVKYVQIFDEPITIKCTSVFNPEAFDTVQVDLLRTPNHNNWLTDISISSTTPNNTQDSSCFWLGHTTVITPTFADLNNEFTTGTVYGEFRMQSWQLTLSDHDMQEIKSALGNVEFCDYAGQGNTISAPTNISEMFYDKTSEVTSYDFDKYFESDYGTPSVNLTVYADYVYNGKVYATVSLTKSFGTEFVEFVYPNIDSVTVNGDGDYTFINQS